LQFIDIILAKMNSFDLAIFNTFEY
jgi:hypothetical protein